MLSERLMRTLRGVLNVTFDASCECSATGYILACSQHWQELLADTARPLTLQRLAFDTEELNRIDTFLQQLASQNRDSSLSHNCPAAQLETVLKCSAPRAELNVKLCCIPLPEGCTMFDSASSGEVQRLFVGIQRMPSEYDSRSIHVATGQGCVLRVRSIVQCSPAMNKILLVVV